jgi:hypothetical protein
MIGNEEKSSVESRLALSMREAMVVVVVVVVLGKKW